MAEKDPLFEHVDIFQTGSRQISRLKDKDILSTVGGTLWVDIAV